MSGLAILLYVEDSGFRSQLERNLEESGRVELIEKPSGISALVNLLGTTRYDAVYVELGEKPHELLDLLEKLSEPRPALLLGGSRSDSEVLVRAMRLRPDAFIVDRELEELPVILERLDRDHSGRKEAHGVIALSGAKGGVGTTLLACELAASLQRAGDRVAVLDLGLHQGDVSIYFDLAPQHTLADIARKGDRLDGEYLHTVAAKHALGLSVIAAPRQLDEAALIGPGHLERTLRFLRREYDWIILDVPQDWGRVSLKAFELADLVLLVTSLEVPALTHARERMKRLEDLGATRDQLRIIVNRSERSRLGGWDFAKVLGRKPDATIPSDYQVALAGINEGKLVRDVAPGGALDTAIQELAATLYQWFDLGEFPIERAPSFARRIGARLTDFRHTVKGLGYGTAR